MDQLVLVLKSGIMWAQYIELAELVKNHGSDDLKTQVNDWTDELRTADDFIGPEDILPSKISL